MILCVFYSWNVCCLEDICENLTYYGYQNLTLVSLWHTLVYVTAVYKISLCINDITDSIEIWFISLKWLFKKSFKQRLELMNL